MQAPAEILEAYGFTACQTKAVHGGLINTTFAVLGENGIPIAALQRMHHVFGPAVNFDIEAITAALAAAKLPTPRLIRTQNGEAFATLEGATWRAITWLHGKCYAKLPSPGIAEAGAKLAARFHRALCEFPYTFQFTRPGVHDTEAHLGELRNSHSEETLFSPQASTLREKILEQTTLLPTMPEVPTRIVHGDLKISNLLFTEEGAGLCLVDLDTMSYGTIAFELGDALRSWANRCGEDVSRPHIDMEVISAAARGYAAGSAGLLTDREIESVIIGLETVSLELATRFCVDVFQDSYFGWDTTNYSCRREHNLLRAKGQLALSRAVAEHREELQERWAAPFQS